MLLLCHVLHDVVCDVLHDVVCDVVLGRCCARTCPRCCSVPGPYQRLHGCRHCPPSHAPAPLLTLLLRFRQQWNILHPYMTCGADDLADLKACGAAPPAPAPLHTTSLPCFRCFCRWLHRRVHTRHARAVSGSSGGGGTAWRAVTLALLQLRRAGRFERGGERCRQRARQGLLWHDLGPQRRRNRCTSA